MIVLPSIAFGGFSGSAKGVTFELGGSSELGLDLEVVRYHLERVLQEIRQIAFRARQNAFHQLVAVFEVRAFVVSAF